MKTRAEYQAAIDEIRMVCRKHGVFLVGTCEQEGIYGEITIGDAADPGDSTGWRNPGAHTTGVVDYLEEGFCYVDGVRPFNAMSMYRREESDRRDSNIMLHLTKKGGAIRMRKQIDRVHRGDRGLSPKNHYTIY